MYSRRHLPHWIPEGRYIFLTWHLYGSLSREQLRRLQADAKLSGGEKFVRMDGELDSVSRGPTWLAQAPIAECVCDALRFGAEELKFYRLYAYVVMSNHVHALMVPERPLPKIMNGLKTSTAKVANKILGRTGMHFWQDESFDHWCRSDEEILSTVRYIENNPVKAGLVREPSEWPWSSAAVKRQT